MLDGGAAAAKAAVVPVPMETIFDSGRPAAADEGLFSDFEASGHEDAEDGSPEATPLTQVKVESPPTPAVPISSGALPPLVSAVVLFFVCISISLPGGNSRYPRNDFDPSFCFPFLLQEIIFNRLS